MYIKDRSQRQLYVYRKNGGELTKGTLLKKGETPPAIDYVLSDPVLYIATAGGAPVLNKVNYVTCTYTIVNDGGYGAVIFTQPGRIRGRGNSTWTMPKKTIQDEAG